MLAGLSASEKRHDKDRVAFLQDGGARCAPSVDEDEPGTFRTDARCMQEIGDGRWAWQFDLMKIPYLGGYDGMKLESYMHRSSIQQL